MRLPFEGTFRITQDWGNKLIINGVDMYAKWGYQGHNGEDYGLPEGTPVLAPHDGEVLEAYFDPGGYGNYVKVENPEEGSILAHLSATYVEVGFQVKEGEVIGLSGNTGNSTGPHLHWGYYKIPRNRDNGYGGTINANPFITRYETQYKVGDEIKPAIQIPVGKKPGDETFDYGMVSHDRPAVITEIKQVGNIFYYNIDQSYIGGGTGWVKAETVDHTPTQNIPDEPTPVDNNKIEELEKELDDLKKFQEISKAYGYNTSDDLKKGLKSLFKAKEQLDKMTQGLNTGVNNLTVDGDNFVNVPIKLNIPWLLDTLGLSEYKEL